jgi:hypothetical protein
LANRVLCLFPLGDVLEEAGDPVMRQVRLSNGVDTPAVAFGRRDLQLPVERVAVLDGPLHGPCDDRSRGGRVEVDAVLHGRLVRGTHFVDGSNPVRPGLPAGLDVEGPTADLPQPLNLQQQGLRFPQRDVRRRQLRGALADTAFELLRVAGRLLVEPGQGAMSGDEHDNVSDQASDVPDHQSAAQTWVELKDSPAIPNSNVRLANARFSPCGSLR